MPASDHDSVRVSNLNSGKIMQGTSPPLRASVFSTNHHLSTSSLPPYISHPSRPSCLLNHRCISDPNSVRSYLIINRASMKQIWHLTLILSENISSNEEGINVERTLNYSNITFQKQYIQDHKSIWGERYAKNRNMSSLSNQVSNWWLKGSGMIYTQNWTVK